ncbi:flavin reductase (DIM6/NTAB) family NADH-FMN oxidoreductase RutF [Streptomyces griseochromogenes]|uniref:Flavin reductase n=1 Tax=Streptomyces griseochromogenes TaxID=68214 RepID=A0A1B1B188_9ACTN|nr:flavin reductase family protein [Streptomyces griseochromogenes]ANP52583.1 flavin reductase [Streptomyces griseochromogenes]MBP2047156.1 flavin reductase (DIM6/NTAB) family NADH-FMN oxidoreductase RutF [Streptomyces griseochromogenes]
MRVDYSPASVDPGFFYHLLTAVVVPRPIAWVSTLSPDGRTANLAPHSFFTVSSARPPVVQFTSVGRKDSLRNVEDTGEFVVNFAPEPLLAQINATATDFPRHEGEFDAVGIEREPSLRLKPPRVAASPVALECTLHSTLRLGDSTVVFGQVVHAAVREDVLVDGRPDITLLRPLARLGGNEWSTIGKVRKAARIPYREPAAG